jgi:CRISPR system Cascade subunit CasE
MTHEGVVYEGVLSVVDAALARRSLADGIGPAKAYGFGLLSLSPCA